MIIFKFIGKETSSIPDQKTKLIYLFDCLKLDQGSKKTFTMVTVKTTIKEQIRSFLDESEIRYCLDYLVYIDNRTRLFDFYLPEQHALIEYDSINHFIEVPYFGKPVKISKELALRKNRWAKSKGYHLLRISYKKRDKYREEINRFLGQIQDPCRVEPIGPPSNYHYHASSGI
jgi:hypothetical protein